MPADDNPITPNYGRTSLLTGSDVRVNGAQRASENNELKKKQMEYCDQQDECSYGAQRPLPIACVQKVSQPGI